MSYMDEPDESDWWFDIPFRIFFAPFALLIILAYCFFYEYEKASNLVKKIGRLREAKR